MMEFESITGTNVIAYPATGGFSCAICGGHIHRGEMYTMHDYTDPVDGCIKRHPICTHCYPLVKRNTPRPTRLESYQTEKMEAVARLERLANTDTLLVPLVRRDSTPPPFKKPSRWEMLKERAVNLLTTGKTKLEDDGWLL
jgi:hypothetical protein